MRADRVDFTALPDGVNRDDYLIVTYLASFPKAVPVPTLARTLAARQSVGTWTPAPGDSPEPRRQHAARVIGVYEVPDYEWTVPAEVDWRTYVLQVAFPQINIGPQIPMLLTTVAGAVSMGRIKVLDVHLPEGYVEGFQGPRFGVPGVRDLLGVTGRPLLGSVVSPGVGYSPEVGVELFRAAAQGGCDLVRDDALLADPSFCRARERVRLYMEVERQVYEETGERTLYIVNVTGEIPQALENARRAAELGCGGVMLDCLSAGFPLLRLLAEEPAVDVPILARMDAAGALFASEWRGLSSCLVLGKLPRLAGADVVCLPTPYGKAPILPSKFRAAAQNLALPLYRLKPTLPMPGGGITPKMVPVVLRDLGSDIVIDADVHAHPDGPLAGARAFRQAVRAVMEGRSLEDAAGECSELRAALKTWTHPFEGMKR